MLQFVVTLTSIKICSNYTLTRWRAGAGDKFVVTIRLSNGVITLQICMKKGMLRGARACGGWVTTNLLRGLVGA